MAEAPSSSSISSHSILGPAVWGLAVRPPLPGFPTHCARCRVQAGTASEPFAFVFPQLAHRSPAVRTDRSSVSRKGSQGPSFSAALPHAPRHSERLLWNAPVPSREGLFSPPQRRRYPGQHCQATSRAQQTMATPDSKRHQVQDYQAETIGRNTQSLSKRRVPCTTRPTELEQ